MGWLQNKIRKEINSCMEKFFFIRNYTEKLLEQIQKEKQDSLKLLERLQKEKENSLKLIEERTINLKKEEQNLLEVVALKETDLHKKAKQIYLMYQNEAELILKQDNPNFSRLAKIYACYKEKRDEEIYNTLLENRKISQNTKDILQSFRKDIKQLRTENLILKNKLDYLSELYPEIYMENEKELESIEEEEEEFEKFSKSNFMDRSEYDKLSPAEKSQLGLDRWIKKSKTKKEIGMCYERYIGYLFENDNWLVDYVGITENIQDKGRDLICKKNNQIIVIQCKCWSKFKTIHEKHIFQFFGTVFQYKFNNKNKKVTGIFYTTTTVSELAKEYAKQLGIVIKENISLDMEYPMIKCNISSTGEKIFHLPFDQQYDRIKIEKSKGEFFVKSIAEAEKLGFRRAKKWIG